MSLHAVHQVVIVLELNFQSHEGTICHFQPEFILEGRRNFTSMLVAVGARQQFACW